MFTERRNGSPFKRPPKHASGGFAHLFVLVLGLMCSACREDSDQAVENDDKVASADQSRAPAVDRDARRKAQQQRIKATQEKQRAEERRKDELVRKCILHHIADVKPKAPGFRNTVERAVEGCAGPNGSLALNNRAGAFPIEVGIDPETKRPIEVAYFCGHRCVYSGRTNGLAFLRLNHTSLRECCELDGVHLKNKASSPSIGCLPRWLATNKEAEYSMRIRMMPSYRRATKDCPRTKAEEQQFRKKMHIPGRPRY